MWNIDETGCFWRALADKGFGQKPKECKGGKQSKNRVTVAFVVKASGNAETKPIENPQCFKGIKKDQLPVQYFSQAKAWMTGDILEHILTEINRKLRSKGRSVILSMDNAGCHPEDLDRKLSNIRIVFLLANTTSLLQPLDLGIIHSFKVHYCKLLMHFILAKIEQCSSAAIIKYTSYY